MNSIKQVFSAAGRFSIAMNGTSHNLQPLTEDEFIALGEGEGELLMLESCSLEEIENTYFYGFPVHIENMLEAITSTMKRVDKTMRAFERSLAQAFSGSDITVDSIDIGDPRTAGGFATLTAMFLLSDGQSISIIFHSPSGDPKRIVADDTLVAFRFLLNKRDVTPTVAPAGGVDISLKQVTLKLANMAEKNSQKFQNKQTEIKGQKDKLESLQKEIEQREGEVTDIIEGMADIVKEKDENLKLADANNRSVAAAETKVNDLKAQIAELDKKIVVRDESLVKGDKDKPEIIDNKPTQLPDADKADYDRIIAAINRDSLTYKRIVRGDEDYRGYDKKAFSQSINGKMKTFAKNNSQVSVDLALTHLAEKQKELEIGMFTDRHSIWKLGSVTAPKIIKATSYTDVEQTIINESDRLKAIANDASKKMKELAAPHKQANGMVTDDFKQSPEYAEYQKLLGEYQRADKSAKDLLVLNKKLLLSVSKERIRIKRANVNDPIIKDETDLDKKANEAATSDTNSLPEPTQAQKEAGNYKKGNVTFQGLNIIIENPKGSTRTGTSPDGSEWENVLQHHYGDIAGTKGADGDKLDVFIGSSQESEKAFIVDQVNPEDGKFDEHKIMLGFDSKAEAEQGYLANYDKGWQGLGNITELTIDELKEWIKTDTTKAYKPADVIGGPEKDTEIIPDDNGSLDENSDVALIEDALANGTDADSMIELITAVATRMQENGSYAENEPLLERLSNRITELLEAQ